MNFLAGFMAAFLGSFVLVPLALFMLRLGGLYAIVPERRCFVYVLFGKVLAVIDEPGLHFLLPKLGLQAFVVNWLGQRYELDMRLDQQYLRSQAVNSEEGAPMGIGIWYEMFVSDPVAYLFKNTDPRGSLATNVLSVACAALRASASWEACKVVKAASSWADRSATRSSSVSFNFSMRFCASLRSLMSR